MRQIGSSAPRRVRLRSSKRAYLNEAAILCGRRSITGFLDLVRHKEDEPLRRPQRFDLLNFGCVEHGRIVVRIADPFYQRVVLAQRVDSRELGGSGILSFDKYV